MDGNRSHVDAVETHISHNREEIVAPAPSISLILPASSEDRTIAQVVREAIAALSRMTADYEILVVDDGSLGENTACLEAAAEETRNVRFIRRPGTVGYGAALRRGLTEATKQCVCIADASGQFDLRQLDRLVLLARDHAVVCGYRIQRSGNALQRIGSNAYDTIVRALLGIGVRDSHCGLKLFRRETVESLSPSSDGTFVHVELLAQSRQLGRSVVEVGVTPRARASDSSKASLTHAVFLFATLLRYWWSSVAFPDSVASRGEYALPNPWAPRRQIAMTLLLIGMCAALFFTNLDYSLIEPDETRYAQIALGMQESGDWVVPKLFREPYLDKPPLLYWTTAACYSLFGANEWATRLPSAFCAMLSVIATYLLGRRLIGDRAAWFGALAVLLSTGFVLCARFLIMDGPLTLFTTLTLLIAANALYRQRAALHWWVAAGVACGMGMLVKGPIAAVICVPPLLAASWLGNVRHSRWRMLLAMLAPCVMLTVPWFLMVLSRQQEFAGHFFWKHHVLRFWNAFDHQAPWWYYLPVLAWGMFPASLLLPALASYVFSHERRQRECRTAQLGFLVASGSWVVVFFSLSSCKLPAYILPAVPMLCLAIGKMLDDTVWAHDSVLFLRQYTARATRLATLLVPAGAIALGICDLVLGSHGALGALTAFGLVATTMMLVAAIWRHQQWGVLRQPADESLPVAASLRDAVTSLGETRLQLAGEFSSAGRFNPWLGVCALCLVVGLYGFAWVFPEFANWRSRAHAAATLKQGLASDVPVVFFGGEHYATRFELGKGEIVQFDRDQLDDFETLMARHPRAVVVTRPFHAEQIREEFGRLITLCPSSAGRDLYVAERTGEAAAQIGGLEASTRR